MSTAAEERPASGMRGRATRRGQAAPSDHADEGGEDELAT